MLAACHHCCHHRETAGRPRARKRPKSSCLGFQAGQPNECWQSGFTHWPLADGSDTEILTWLDDHSRYALRVTAHQPVTGPVVLEAFRASCATYGVPASTLTDNGLVFTTRFAGGKGGRNALENELSRLGVIQKMSRLGVIQKMSRLGVIQKNGKAG